MSIEEAIARLEEHTQYCVPVDDLESFEMAVDALRAQQTKLDRSRWEACGYCIEDVPKWCLWKFCPECGRPLTEQAWAELERKVGANDETAD